MSDAPLTAAAIMSWVQRHEETCAAFYQTLAERYPAEAKRFGGYAQDSTKYQQSITRTYQETVTDALETNFGFEGVILVEPDLSLAEDASQAQAATLALDLEQQTIALYGQIAEAAESLLATIPGAFRRVVRRRQKRLPELKTLAS